MTFSNYAGRTRCSLTSSPSSRHYWHLGIKNAIRPCAIGRRNWLFIGHPEAGDRAAIFYSIMASCRLHGLNPYDYLCDVLRRLPGAMASEVEQFTPAAWAKTRRTAAR